LSGPSTLDVLERLLHAEHHAILLGHRDLMTLPLDERVERGESLCGLRFLGETRGRIRLGCRDNLAKFRPGDALRLGYVEPLEGGHGLGVVYESFDDASSTLIVSRDPFRSDGSFDAGAPLQLDPEIQSLTGLALDALERVRRGRSVAARFARDVLDGVWTRECDATRRSDAAARAEACRPPFDPSQREALMEALTGEPLTLVQGPPGTGKTYVLARIVSALASRGERVLVVAYTHRAVNHALRTVSAVDPGLPVVKAGKTTGADDLRGSPVALVPSLRKLPALDGAKRVVGATLFSLQSAWEAGAFDRVVLDEAAQVPVAYGACALLCAPRAILVGDHRQLGPIVQGRHADPLASRSLFEHAIASARPAVLRTTYRMNAGLCAFPSEVFYEGTLHPSPRSAPALFAAAPGGSYDALFDPLCPAVLALVPHEGHRTRCEPEARIVAGIVLDRIVRQGGDPRGLAVVAPYRAQLRLIRTLVRRGLAEAGARGPLPVIDTVERIQGQERDMVVVSMTASDPDHLAGDAGSFFYSASRLNVTLTRARTKLIIVASPLAFEALPRTFEGMRDVERFRRLRRALPAIEVAATTP